LFFEIKRTQNTHTIYVGRWVGLGALAENGSFDFAKRWLGVSGKSKCAICAVAIEIQFFSCGGEKLKRHFNSNFVVRLSLWFTILVSTFSSSCRLFRSCVLRLHLTGRVLPKAGIFSTKVQ